MHEMPGLQRFRPPLSLLRVAPVGENASVTGGSQKNENARLETGGHLSFAPLPSKLMG